MKYCSNCGTEIHAGYGFCPECGNPVSPAPTASSVDSYEGKYKICRNCGEQMPEDAFYCLACGMTFDSLETGYSKLNKRVRNTRFVDTSVGVWKNKWISLILCFFFGIFGLHRFYEGKVITGLIFLFTLGLLGFGWLVDMIILIMKPNPYRVK